MLRPFLSTAKKERAMSGVTKRSNDMPLEYYTFHNPICPICPTAPQYQIHPGGTILPNDPQEITLIENAFQYFAWEVKFYLEHTIKLRERNGSAHIVKP